MKINPEVRALRGDNALQRHAQDAMRAALARWEADPRCSAFAAGLEAYGSGSGLKDCPQLTEMFGTNTQRADCNGAALVQALLAHFLPVLEAMPLGQMPFRHGFDGKIATLLLARKGRARVMLTGFEPGPRVAECAGFSDGERHEIVLAGAAQAQVLRRSDQGDKQAQIITRDVTLKPGARLSLDMACEALHLRVVHRRMISLRLSREALNPVPSREHRLSDGGLIKQAAGSVGDSRQELMCALLGRMNHAAALPVIAGIARDGSDNLRWQALRECLALDTAAGFQLLCDIARDSDDPLAGHAGALRAQLVEAHPVLKTLENA